MSGSDILINRRETLVLTAGAATLSYGLMEEAQAAFLPRPKRASGRDIPFDNDWRFRRGDGAGLEHPDMDDSMWRRVDLPHDWSIEDVPGGQAPAQLGPFDSSSKGGTATGFTLGGEGWYRKHFQLEGLAADARVEILFDGIYLESDIWLNGQHLAGNVSEYRPFAVDLSPALNRSGNNVLAVRVRNLGQNSRWYSGSGIYRQVKLDVLPAATRLARWGVGAWTRHIDSAGAKIDVSTAIINPDPNLEVCICLRDKKGLVVAEARAPASADVKQQLIVRTPHLWSPDRPYLYTLEAEVRRGTQALDHMIQDYGIRIVTMDTQCGMTINGSRIKLRGGCIHHDNGLLGACAFADADERRIRLLKARGYNAIRSAHNIPSRSLRQACDRLGMFMIAEAFDVWHAPKLPDDFSTRFHDHWHEMVEAMVLSARNSPSVIMWSIGNEIPSRATDEGVSWEWQLANAVRRLDPTRPVTAALNGVLGAPMRAGEGTARPSHVDKTDNASTIFLDVPGYNYRLEDIEAEHLTHPERVVYASETFPRDVFDYAALTERAPYFLGEFVWTAMDYLGEAGIGASVHIDHNVPYYMAAWPWVGAWCGDIDLIGHQKAPSLARDVAWGISALEMTVQRPVPSGQRAFIANWGWADELESWNWPNMEGAMLTVQLYSSAEHVELWLNGTKIGEKQMTAADKMKAEFKLPYAPGQLEARAYSRGKLIARKRLETTSEPVRLLLTAETREGHNDRQSLYFVGIDCVDAKGRIVPDEARKITLSISGPADLIGFGSANPKATGSIQSTEALTYHGRALAILRAQGGKGMVQIEAHSAGLQAGSTKLNLLAF